MPVIAMLVTSVAEHSNASSLMVYRFSAPNQPERIVVANLDATYAVGDVVAIALAGTTLLDGTRIKAATLRGVGSEGMAIEVVSVDVGTDLSEKYSQPHLQVDVGAHVKFPSIALLHNIKNAILLKSETLGTSVEMRYRGKVKLHGTNAGVQVLPDGRIIAQGRNRTLTLEDDNCLFASWVATNKSVFETLVKPDRHLTIFGEWCGKGIQKNVAINGIGRKVFVVFAVQFGHQLLEESTLVVEPKEISKLLPSHRDMFVLPWYNEEIFVDFRDPTKAVATMNKMVSAVEDNDPWVKATFDVDGVGEGLVFYAQIDSQSRNEVSAWMFKAKGEKHRVRKSKAAVEIDPELLANIGTFVDTFATDHRFEQGVSEACEPPLSMKQMGGFLRWINEDILKEGADELADSGLEWKQLSKAISTKARKWFQHNL